MITLLPKLSPPAAERLLEAYLHKGPGQWQGFDAKQFPEAVRFTPTGGSPVTSKQLDELRAGILDIAKSNGYGSADSRRDLSGFDAQVAAWLAGQEFLKSGEAHRDDVWAFVSIVMMPDITGWRFGDTPERYLGGMRNTFQRLWMRGYLFDRGEKHLDRWGLLDRLTEDAFVQITERPSVAGNPSLAIAIAEAWVRASLYHGKGAMESLTRRALPVIRVRNEVRCLDELPSESLAVILDEIFGTPVVESCLQIAPYKPVEKTAVCSFRSAENDALIRAATQLLAEAKRWGLLSPKSNAALQSMLALEFELTSSERNALRYLFERMDGVGICESEIRLMATVID